MNEDEQRIAIAEVCGYKYRKCTTGCGQFGWHAPDGSCLFKIHNLPDYLNSLEDMNDAENELNFNQQCHYLNTC